MNGNPTLEQVTVGAGLALRAAGQWTVHYAPDLEKIVEDTEKRNGGSANIIIDVSEVSSLDTFGAWLIERMRRSLTHGGVEPRVAGLSDNYASLVNEVRQVKTGVVHQRRRQTIVGMLEGVGRSVVEVGGTLIGLIGMLGAILNALFRVIRHPTSFRFTSMIHHLEQVCWRAVPIVVLITFLIGCIIAQQGIFHFRKFGADVFVVDMLGVLVLRELGVLLVAIMVAGRSGSAYTAELGSMRMREEVDALRTMGFDPTEVLILPRIVALIIAMPILAFLGAMAALYGGGLVAWGYGGVQPDAFLSRLKEAISINHFTVGMVKAPFMALVIGIVACVEGAAVKGSAESLGQHTTASVVKSIFFVIVMDGLFAIFFATINIQDWMMAENFDDHIIRVRDLTVKLNENLILDHLDLDVRRGEILGFVGASGAGKSVLTRTIIGLIPKLAGNIEVFGVDMGKASEDQRRAVERRWGVLFQHGALFSSLNVRQNIQFPVREFMNVSERLLDEIAIAKLAMVGLKPEVADRFPSELSGGMIKRVALARALALDPEIVFLDEPTSGLDPISAGDFDQLVMTLQRTLGLTVFMVTHDLDSLKTACNRIAVLGDRKVLLVGTMDDMLASQHPWLRAYFHGKRARAVVA